MRQNWLQLPKPTTFAFRRTRSPLRYTKKALLNGARYWKTMSNYDINTDPRMKPKVARVAVGKETVIEHCCGCPYYQKNELKDWEFCHKELKDVQLRVGQRFPIWCPLEPLENATT